MLALLQLLKLLNAEQRAELYDFLIDNDEIPGALERADSLEYYFHSMFGIEVELTENQIFSIARLLTKEDKVKSAFKTMEIA